MSKGLEVSYIRYITVMIFIPFLIGDIKVLGYVDNSKNRLVKVT